VKHRALLFLSLGLLSFSAGAAEFCDLNLRYVDGELRWNAIPGAVRYTVLESYGDLKAPFYYSTTRTFTPVNHRVSVNTSIRYVVTAEVEDGVRISATSWADACTGMADIVIAANASFRKFTRRAILPVVGSTPGAFGGRFKTAIELRGAANEHGRIVFHPAGKVATDDDPSIEYSFVAQRAIVYDDIVAAMGQSGLGSLEIIPGDDSTDRIPEMSVRLYNETAMGTFGTYTQPVFPYDYLRPASMQVRIPDARFRVNAGIRALEATTVQAIVRRADGRLDGIRSLSFPAGWMEMKSISDFIGVVLAPGDQVTFSYTGAAVPFYTITENLTNDPTLVVPPAQGTTRDVGSYVD
jgi:hypothetical protein